MENPKVYKNLSAGIQVHVTPKYMVEESNPSIGKFIFSYHVVMTNQRERRVKLLNRHWNIYESILIQREVKGEGVVGVQPELGVDESFQYTSWCPLNNPIGKMVGKYEFKDLESGEKFFVQIPEFVLVADFVLS